MSDRKLKTAEELGISQEEYDALLKVRHKLASGELRYVPKKTLGRQLNVGFHPNDVIFNMNDWESTHKCGTARCIGGHMALEIGLPSWADYEDTTYNGPLYNLCWDWGGGDPAAAEAVLAIDRFLSGNIDNPWLVESPVKRAWSSTGEVRDI